jgi:hypothetical protein
VLATLIIASETAHAEPRTPSLGSEAWALKYELAGLFATISYAGWRDWKWGTAYFRFNSEGWLGMDTGAGGQDKVGHCYSSFLMAEFLYLQLRVREGRRHPVTIYPSLFVWTLMTYVEFFDGFSVDHGFSNEDLIMDTVGTGLAFLRHRVPAIERAVDFRMEYFPSVGMPGMHPMIDYSGQKFLLAFKASGLGVPRGNALRYTELLLGYYTRGFMDYDRGHFDRKIARAFVGVGINLETLFRDALGVTDTDAYAGSAYDYAFEAMQQFQLPDTYPSVTVHERSAPIE